MVQQQAALLSFNDCFWMRACENALT
jgi:hypothetical protein